MGLGLVLVGWAAIGHSGFPAQAPFVERDAPCSAYSARVPFAWSDSDAPTPFGPASIEFIATSHPIPTFDPGSRPALPGPVVARGVDESSAMNTGIWQTATVASGHYHLWSIVHEPPEEVGSIVIIERTPQVVTIVHGADRVGPSIAVTRPSTPLAMSSGEFEIRYTACDPNGTARVAIEVGRDGRFERVASDLPAMIDGRWRWSTAGLEAGTWTIRAWITDECGHVGLGYGRFYVDVLDAPDAGVARDVQLAPPVEASTDPGARCDELWRYAGAPPDGGPRDATVPADAAEPRDGPSSCRGTPGWPLLAVLALRRRGRS